MLKLRISGDANNESIWLVEPKISVGRAASNNLVLSDPEVDDCHIEIFAKGEELIIHRRSDARTLVNGDRLGVKARLVANDKVQIGNTTLEVVDPKLPRGVRPERPEASEAQRADYNIAQSLVMPGEGWQLKSSHAGLTRSSYDISDGMTIGRAKDCDIVILLAHLSRRHAQFRIVGNNRLEITDLNSSNGTYVNGEQITTVILNDGDEVKFDTLPFTVVGPADDLDKTMVRAFSAEELQAQMANHMQKQAAMQKKEAMQRQESMYKPEPVIEDEPEPASEEPTAPAVSDSAQEALQRDIAKELAESEAQEDVMGGNAITDDFELDDQPYEPMFTNSSRKRRYDTAGDDSCGSVVAIGVISTVLLIGTIGWLFF
ncbi:FHA domain-containing protein [Halioxenophilus aromaticivorans]|uniref:FHA domain-containing protein n=1 Tax=Halioxenophilus aromaticivorans TaxID=1306992 RepID=A0AAV3TXS2_9ALTE